MMDAIYMGQKHLDDKISHQLSTNGLVDACTMLKTEDRQEIMVNMYKSLGYQDLQRQLSIWVWVIVYIHSLVLILCYEPKFHRNRYYGYYNNWFVKLAVFAKISTISKTTHIQC
jgi:hypothetical protein